MKELGVNGQWGIFSKVIPGRVGYQCSNFYRHLIETNEISDPNYTLDEKGKAHYLGKKGRTPGSSNEKNGLKRKRSNTRSTSNKQMPRMAKKKRGKKKKNSDDEDSVEEEEDDEYIPTGKMGEGGGEAFEEGEEIGIAQNAQKNNPLPGFIDQITLEPVERPAISPYGHVLSYSTWLQCLAQDPKNTCPFSKNPLKKRDITILTWENIAEHKSKIVNLS
jgi:hypothetical protein